MIYNVRPCYARPMKPSLTVLPFTVALALLLLACKGSLEEYPDARSVFRATYSASPPVDVTNLQAYGRAFRDSSTCYLRFNAPFARVQSLVGRTFTEIAPASFTSSTSNAGISGPTPSWWVPPLTATSKFYSSTGFHPSFSSGQAYLAYDSATQLAYFYWNGSD